MTLRLRLIYLACFVALVSAGQVPKVNGVYGGIPTPTSVGVDAVAEPLVSGTPVAGKMRFIENSGVCGGFNI